MVELEASEGGTVYGGGEFISGEFAQITAEANPNYSFAGWYIGEELFSTEYDYRFLVRENAVITAHFEPTEASVLIPIYSMFNPTTQEHLFVMEGEIAVLEAYGWLLDGISFYSGTEGLPVYRLYNGVEHFYTYSEDEKAACIAAGWTYDGILCFTQTDGILLYRLFNESNGLHYYSAIQSIIDSMVADGWKLEGPAWFAAEP